MLTQQRLKELVSYDPETGVFTSLARTGGTVTVGTILATSDNGMGHRRLHVDGRRYYAHRLAYLYMTGKWPSEHIDHANGDPSDNRRDNIRAATQSQNLANAKTRKDNRLGIKGVHQFQNGYRAQIQCRGKTHRLGIHPTIEAASAAYHQAATRLFGEFARANP